MATNYQLSEDGQMMSVEYALGRAGFGALRVAYDAGMLTHEQRRQVVANIMIREGMTAFGPDRRLPDFFQPYPSSRLLD